MFGSKGPLWPVPADQARDINALQGSNDFPGLFLPNLHKEDGSYIKGSKGVTPYHHLFLLEHARGELGAETHKYQTLIGLYGPTPTSENTSRRAAKVYSGADERRPLRVMCDLVPVQLVQVAERALVREV